MPLLNGDFIISQQHLLSGPRATVFPPDFVHGPAWPAATAAFRGPELGNMSVSPTLPERSTTCCTRITPTSEAAMQHSPKTSANWRFSWWLKPKERAADEDVKSTMSVEVAAAA